jgi:hypothetical protein
VRRPNCGGRSDFGLVMLRLGVAMAARLGSVDLF